MICRGSQKEFGSTGPTPVGWHMADPLETPLPWVSAPYLVTLNSTAYAYGPKNSGMLNPAP